MTVLELLQDQFDEMLYDEDSYGLDFAEVYNVLQQGDVTRAKEMLDMLGIEY